MDRELRPDWRVVIDASCWSRRGERAGGIGMSQDMETVLSFYTITLFTSEKHLPLKVLLSEADYTAAIYNSPSVSNRKAGDR